MKRKTKMIRFLPGPAFFLLALFFLSGSDLRAQLWSYHTGSGGSPVIYVGPPRYYTGNLSSPFPFADWWTSILTNNNNGLGNYLAALPLVYEFRRTSADRCGLAVQYPGAGTFNENGNHDSVTATPFSAELHVHPRGWNQANVKARADGYSDWTVRVEMDDGTAQTNLVTLVKGSPFFYVDTKNTPRESFYFSAAVSKAFTAGSTNAGLGIGTPVSSDHLAFVSASGKYYAVFAGPNTVFKMENANRVYITNYGNYFSVAVFLNQADLNTYYQAAYSFVSGSAVSWAYNESSSLMTVTYNVSTTLKRGGFPDTPLICLFPHHWKHSSAAFLPVQYPTVRGSLKLFAGKTFATPLKFRGVLPFFPEPTASCYQRSRLQGYINTMQANYTSWDSSGEPFDVGDTYFAGKSLARCANLIPIAHAAGYTNSRNYLKTILRAQLANWLTDGGAPPLLYCYFNSWGTMVGTPYAFGTQELNDHNFHHGYFIYSSALLSMFDPQFIADYGGMVEHLIRDANSPNRADPMYAFLNCLDIYEGHSWVSGYGRFDDGNNIESSSEAMNFWAGVYLWGLITHNNTYRDLGIFGYCLENSAIDEYWFDKEKSNFHPSYSAQNLMTCLVWGGKYDKSTWFSPQSEAIHGIQWLPVNPASVYLNYQPSYAQAHYDEMVAENGGPENEWYDVIWKYQSLFAPDAALSKFTNSYGLISGINNDKAGGNSTADVYSYLCSMKGMGDVSTNYYADTSSYGVFIDSGLNATYVAYNPNATIMTARFYRNGSLEYSLAVPPLSVRSSRMTNRRPIPDFSITDVTPYRKIFNASATTDPYGLTLFYAWDLDGDSVIDRGYGSGLAVVTNTYATLGTNLVTLFVTNSAGYSNSVSRYCYRVVAPSTNQPPAAEEKQAEFEVPKSANIALSISYPSPLRLGRDADLKFCVYEKSRVNGFPDGTVVYLYDIAGNPVWASREALNYEYNVIRCAGSVLKEKRLQNETLICVVKNGSSVKKFRVLVLP